ncbi:MAG: DoxX family protein [Prolixibacteraceae bacterium]
MKKRNLIIYWVATALLAFGMLGSGLAQLFHAEGMVDLVIPLGYPMYFLTIIGVWKILGVAAILVPRFTLLKEWAYAGFFFTMSGALFSHLATGVNDVKEILGPVFQLVFIILSWYFRPANRKIALNESKG